MLEAVPAHQARDAGEVLPAVIAVWGGAGAGSENESSSGNAAAHASSAPPAAPGGAGGAARPYDAFISYAHEDGMDVAARLEEGLARRGLRVWRDETRLRLGDTLSDEIMRGLDNSSHAIVVVSPAYADSRWTMIELGGMMRGELRGRIIPVLYETDRGRVASRLPMLADRLAGTWDDDAEHLMDEIAQAVKDTRQAKPKEPAAQAGCGTADMDLIARASEGAAASITREISGITMGRGKHIDAVEGLLASKGRAAIVGDKGSGKSVVSCLLYERLAERGAALLVRCDDFLDVESAEELDMTIVPGRSLARLAGTAARAPHGAAGGMTIIFDSLDAAGRNERTMRAFRRLLEMLWGAGARTVVTVRRYDYEYSGSIRTTNWGKKYELGPLSDDEVCGMLSKLGNPAVPPGLKKLLSNPLNLHLFSLVLKKSPGVDLASIGGEIDLYDAHWRHYVELEPLGERVRNALYVIAEEMTRARRTLVPYAPGDPEAAARAQSSGILVRTEDGGSIRYFHHAYMDYAMSRALLERHQPVEKHLRADEHNMFLRPTLSFALAMAHKRDPGVFASIVEGIVRADIKHHWKITALESLASVEPEDGTAYAKLKTLLTDQPVLQQHFLIALARRRNASWLLAWGDTLSAWIADSHSHNGPYTIDYLAAAAAADGRCHDTAFAVIRVLAGGSANGQVRKKAVAALAGINAKGGTEWLKSMSKSDDPHVREGVALNLPILLKRDPDAVPEIFSNMYAYEETSTDETDMLTYGRLRLTRTKARANDMNRRALAGMFPQLVDANPPVMVKAFVLAAESVSRGILSCPGTGFVDDSAHGPWYMEFHKDGASPLACIAKYMAGCADEDFSKLIPPLERTRLAVLRAILIDYMARRMPAFLGKLANLLSDPRMHEARALERIVGRAIGEIDRLLDDGQRGRILGAMGGPRALRGKPGSAARGGHGAGDAQLASAPPPRQARQAAQRRHGAGDAQLAASPLLAPTPGRPAHPCRLSAPGMGHAAPEPGHGSRAPVEEAEGSGHAARIEGMLDRDLDRGGKISLLESILGALDGRPGDLGGDLAYRVEAFLIEARRDADPEVDEGAAATDAAAAEPGSAPQPARSVRGLAAECLIRLAPRRKDGAVLDAVRELSEDPAGAVRRDVARSIEHLFPTHYGLARSIAVSYSRDTDERVLSSLTAPLRHVASKDPAAASAAIANILESPARPPNGLVHLLLWLAIDAREPRSAELLRRIADEGAFSKDLRKGIPFVLKNEYLANRSYRDAALDVLYDLLHDPDHMVRYNAAFFTLHGFDDNPAIDDREYIREIEPHLDRVSSLLEEKPLDLGIAEALTSFLVKFWKEVPETALACLEKTVKIHGASAATEPTTANDSLGVLAGLLQYHSLYDSEWNRCIDILDMYAAAGWPMALDLLAGMGARD